MCIETHFHRHTAAPVHPFTHGKVVFADEDLGAGGTPFHGVDGAAAVAHDCLQLAGRGEEAADTVLGAGGEDGAVGVPGDRGDGFFGGFDPFVGDAGRAGGEGERGAGVGVGTGARGGRGGGQEIPKADKAIGRAGSQEIDVFRVPSDVGNDVAVFCPYADFIPAFHCRSDPILQFGVFIFIFGAGTRSTGFIG